MLAIFTGIRREHEAIEKNITVLERHQTEDGYFISVGEFGGKPVLICRTHMGQERVKGIADQIFHQYPVSAVLSARLAVASPRELRVGDLAICQKTYLCRAPGVITDPSGESDFRLMEIAGRTAHSIDVPHRVGNALTIEPLQPRSLEQRALDHQRSIIAVDTDGFWLAEASFAHSLPFLSVRASLADVYGKAPQMIDMVGPNASVSPFRFLREAIAHPAQFPNMAKLTDAVFRASRSLSRFGGAFLREYAEQPMPTPDRSR